jgi:hypothetical protein
MNKTELETDVDSSSVLSQKPGGTLVRFIIAACVASVITFTLLFFMKYLIMGYDKSATNAISQYFTLRTIDISDGKEEKIKRIERPGDRPDVPELEESEFKEESKLFLEQNALDMPSTSVPEKIADADIALPQLAPPALTTQEKLIQIKEGILSEKDSE